VTNESTHPFETLTPDFILGAIEQQGYITDGRLFALNSYENRVYQIGIEDAEPLVAKFYRPGRWTDAQIAEEHEFCFELAEHEIPVVAPLRNENGDSLMSVDGFRFSLYPRRGGRTPDIDDLDNLLVLGRLLGRIHRLGASRPFKFRPAITVQTFGYDAVAVVAADFIPADLRTPYDTLIGDLMRKIETRFAEAGDVQPIRVHGDCHSGNILWRDDTPHFVDFDDARMAPAVQDVWMLLSGDSERQRAQLSEIIEGYKEFHDFDLRELHLIEPLRTLRLLHYNAWLAERWDDPAFPRTFTWFNEPRYWEQHILDLREQFAALDEPPLEVFGL
jgi:Ser/Thr protein kinase RdoA (MazF antagonist)